MSTPPAKPPEILDKIVDLVLSYKGKRSEPKARSLASSNKKAELQPKKKQRKQR